MSRLDVRLLGGFEVWHGDQPLTGFESQKVRALLAYLILNRNSAHSRDRLAGLLWPDTDDDTARRNLRQAVYNLRTTLPHSHTPAPPILATYHSVQFNPETDYWLDVEAFADAVRRGTSATGGVAPRHLAIAAQLYRGDLLAGFFVTDSPAFEHWLLYEQERLREMAIQTLRALVEYYLTHGEHQFGIQYARRLLEIDSLSEEAHRSLMRLYALSGRRSRALAQYEDCRDLLQVELGVEPLEETTALYQAILAREWPVGPALDEKEPACPRIPLVGREAAYARLRCSWEAARRGMGRLTLVEGETGIGKTRLVEEVIGHATSQAGTTVLRGCCYEFAAQVGYQPVAEALRRAIADQTGIVQQAVAGTSPHWLAEVARIVPQLRALRSDLPKPAPPSWSEARQRLFEAIARFLRALAQPSGQGQPAGSLILFMDDLHCADRSSLDLVEYLVRRLAGDPIWIVAAYRTEGLDAEHPLLHLRRQLSRDQLVDRVALKRLDLSAVEQLAGALAEDEGASELARFLHRESQGVPLIIAELFHNLCDEGILVVREGKKLALPGPLRALATPIPKDLHALIMQRVSRLPMSARRLLTLAAIIGPQFDAELLREAANEQMAVVEAGIDVWLERRLVTGVPGGWAEGVRETDSETWATAARRGTFEFAHEEIRLVIYQDVNKQRRQAMHRQVATALEQRYAGDTAQVCEALAHHYTEAEVWDRAITYLQQAGDKARRALAPETALGYYDKAVEVLEQLESAATSEAERVGWLEKRSQVLASREEIYAAAA